MTTITQPFQCDPQPELQETHRTTHTGTTTRCRTQRRNQFATETTAAAPAAPLQPLYTEKCKVSCSGFLPQTKPMEHSCSHYYAFRSITWLTRQFPSSPLPLITTSLPHHFPSSPLPTLTTYHRHHFPSSPPCVIASYSFVMYCDVMSSSPPLSTSHRHHFPSSPLPIVTTSLPHHFPSSPLPFVTTSLPHHFPSSPLPFFTTLCHSFLFFCHVLWCDVPRFINVKSQNSICP